MKETVRRKWVRALKSGKYKQTKNVLKGRKNPRRADSVGYCCLGVLCDIYLRETKNGEWVSGPRGDTCDAFEIDEKLEETGLPPEVKAWADIDASLELELSSYNDGTILNSTDANEKDKPFNFKEIAHFIENFAP